ncbi:reverse transcriptase domain-containing protein [Tanacetum coccineum]
MHKRKRLPMDTRSGKSISKHEGVYNGTANGNRTKTQGRTDNVPLGGQRGDKCSPPDGKGLTKTEEIFPSTPGSAKKLDEEEPPVGVQTEEAFPESWVLFIDGSSCLEGSGARLILTNPEGKEFTYALSENKKADALSKIASTSFAHLTKQVLVETLKRKSIEEREILAIVEEEECCWMTPLVEYLTEGTLPAEIKKARTIKIKARQYAMISEVLYRKSFMEPWLRCVGPMQAEYVVKKIHEGSCSMHSGPRSVVAKAIRSGYYWPTMHKDARSIIRACNDCQTHRPVPRNLQQKLTPITSPWPFYKWGIDISGPFPEAQGKVKFLIVAIDYFTKWIEAKPVATITGSQFKKFVWDNIVCRFGLPEKSYLTTESISGTIRLKTGVRSLISGKAENDEGIILNLDILEERRDKAVAREARSKAKMKKYYNTKVRNTSFRPGNFVYRSNEASHGKESGKLGPKWEGPYEVIEALGKGTYKLRNSSEDIVPRTWNVQDLKKCYL